MRSVAATGRCFPTVRRARRDTSRWSSSTGTRRISIRGLVTPDTPRIERSTGVGVVQVDERLGADTLTTRFVRDALGRIQDVFDAAGSRTHYDRDGLGRGCAARPPRRGRDDDSVRRRRQPDPADGRARRGGRNDLRWREPPADRDAHRCGRTGRRQVVYHYDDPSPKFPDDATALGELTWVEDAAGEEHYRHDERGHAVETIRVVDGKEYGLAAEYDDVDRLARVSYPDGRTLDYRYTARGLLTEVPGIVNRIDYNEQGLATRREYANGAVSTAHYDAMDRVDALGTVARGQTVQALAIGYDRVGNVTSIVDAAHAGGPLAASRTFGYDDLYRLRTAEGVAGKWSYDFDATGNWSAKSDLGPYAYAGKPHQPTAVGGASGYAFDEAGHLIARPGSRQTYDAKGRLTSVALDDGTTVTYRYDYAGMVAVKETTGPGGRHRTVYADKLAEERDGVLVDYVFAGGLRIARVGGEHLDPLAAGMLRLPPFTGATGLVTLLVSLIVALVRPSRRRRIRALAAFGLAFLMFDVGCGGDGGPPAAPSLSGAVYYHHDHLGGVVLETDDTGAVVQEASFDPYGGDLQAPREPYGFTGKERDRATGLYDFGARVYDPKLALFLSPGSGAPRRSRARGRRPAAPLDLRLRPEQPHQPHRPGWASAAHPGRRAGRRPDRRGFLPRQGGEQRELLVEGPRRRDSRRSGLGRDRRGDGWSEPHRPRRSLERRRRNRLARHRDRQRQAGVGTEGDSERRSGGSRRGRAGQGGWHGRVQGDPRASSR